VVGYWQDMLADYSLLRNYIKMMGKSMLIKTHKVAAQQASKGR
jgi:hypothetical protein